MDDPQLAGRNHSQGKIQVWTGLAAFLLIILEVSWLLPWYLGVIEISHTPNGMRAFFVLGGNMLLAYLVTRFTENLHLKRSIQQILLLGLFLINMALATHWLLDQATPNPLKGLISLDPGPVLVVMAGAWLWWRGISLAQGMITPETAWSRFWFGIWMLVAFLLLIARVTRVQPNIIPFLIFLGSGLLALIISRVAYVNQFYGSQQNPFSRGWLPAISATVAASILLAALFASLLTKQFNPVLEQLTQALRWIVSGIIFLASIPGLILTYLISPLLEAFQALSQRLETPAPNVTPDLILTPIAPLEMPEAPKPLTIPPWFISLLFWLLVLMITLVIFRRLHKMNSSRSTQNLEEPETLLGRNELWRKLRQAARQQLQETSNSLLRLRVLRIKQAAYIRNIYAELMVLMESLEKPRPMGITPLEFLPAMQATLPGVHADLLLITQAYNRVRYGELPESSAEVLQIKQAWERVASEGSRQKTLLLAIQKHQEEEQSQP